MIDYYTADVVTANDYYPFGMQMPGRKFDTGSGYRYGYNGQEKSNEVTKGNYTAEFWEYDSRIGRRWNVDPVLLPNESPYLVNDGNPILYLDPYGDFKTKFGARWNKFWYGGKSVGKNKYDEWYVNKEIKKDGAKGSGNVNNEVIVGTERYYGKGRNAWSTAAEALIRDEEIKQDIWKKGDKSMYQIYNSEAEAGNAAASYFGLLLPNPFLKSGTIAANTTKAVNSANEGVIVGTGSVLRKIDFFKGFKHAFQKHLVGDGSVSLKVLDANGTLEKWGNYVTLLAQTGKGTTVLVEGGEVLQIMGQMEKTGGGILNVGVRLFKASGKDTWQLTTILTRQ